MSVPERLMLIGGSILVASIFIFGLRDGVNSWLPNIGNNISNIFSQVQKG